MQHLTFANRSEVVAVHQRSQAGGDIFPSLFSPEEIFEDNEDTGSVRHTLEEHPGQGYPPNHHPSLWIVTQKDRYCLSCRHMRRQPDFTPSRETLDEQCAPASSPSRNNSHPRVTTQNMRNDEKKVGAERGNEAKRSEQRKYPKQ
ncbi:hypothetical protein K439DRAFT_1614676 [Ramaria rubella]|nr:hypothetical protein K439DRAFT_1614676 [Ramaria rubella]